MTHERGAPPGSCARCQQMMDDAIWEAFGNDPRPIVFHSEPDGTVTVTDWPALALMSLEFLGDADPRLIQVEGHPGGARVTITARNGAARYILLDDDGRTARLQLDEEWPKAYAP